MAALYSGRGTGHVVIRSLQATVVNIRNEFTGYTHWSEVLVIRINITLLGAFLILRIGKECVTDKIIYQFAKEHFSSIDTVISVKFVTLCVTFLQSLTIEFLVNLTVTVFVEVGFYFDIDNNIRLTIYDLLFSFSFLLFRFSHFTAILSPLHKSDSTFPHPRLP
jgi:hypothetical protein